jgi:voltage-gated potassium channel
MVPLIVYGVVDSTAIVESTIGTVRFLALFRLARLYNIALMIRGSEILLLSTLAIVSVIFGTIGIYIVESPDPHANIRSLYNAFWWSIETMTTIAYGEYYPVTASGRIIATFLMLAGIGILWSVVATVTSKLVELKLKKEKNTTIMVGVKSSIKDKIDNVEKLSPEEINDLIRLIRSLNSKDRY